MTTPPPTLPAVVEHLDRDEEELPNVRVVCPRGGRRHEAGAMRERALNADSRVRAVVE